MIFQRSAACYDALYAWKDYEAEAAAIERVIHDRRPQAQTLLDVACGSGKHLEHLRAHYRVEGLDLSQELLAIARARLPGVTLHYGDMLDFELGRRFDVVTCLFSAIGYACTLEKLHGAVDRMAGHLGPGGLLIVEPWFGPDSFLPGRLDVTFVDEPERKIARMNVSQVDGALSALDFHYLVGTSEGVESFRERHELGLFTHEQYLEAFATAGLVAEHDPQGVSGRGLYVAS
ncbi:MAG: class I SAM-dependent methyltransferase [Gaiellaceae bacterium]